MNKALPFPGSRAAFSETLALKSLQEEPHPSHPGIQHNDNLELGSASFNIHGSPWGSS